MLRQCAAHAAALAAACLLAFISPALRLTAMPPRAAPPRPAPALSTHCHVCGEDDEEEQDQQGVILCCARCRMHVHAHCYYMPQAPPPDQPWLCDPCSLGLRRPPPCALCPGAYLHAALPLGVLQPAGTASAPMHGAQRLAPAMLIQPTASCACCAVRACRQAALPERAPTRPVTLPPQCWAARSSARRAAAGRTPPAPCGCRRRTWTRRRGSCTCRGWCRTWPRWGWCGVCGGGGTRTAAAVGGPRDAATFCLNRTCCQGLDWHKKHCN